MDYTQCVGFADCPCRKCRDMRLAMTAAHPTHAHIQDRSYCGTCRTEERARYALPHGATA